MPELNIEMHPQLDIKLSFDNTEVAFRHKSNEDLNRAYWLFKAIGNNFLTQVGPSLTNLAFKIGLPISPLIKSTIFKQFCGGETIAECEKTIKQLYSGGVDTILDYSVEGEETEEAFDATCEEIIRIIKRADGDPRIPLTVFKPTGVGRFALYEKLDAKIPLTNEEEIEFRKVKARFDKICKTASNHGVPIMIDAEESWIQDTIDDLAIEMMRKYNRAKLIVYNTYQLYRHDKLASLKADIALAETDKFYMGAKLVRGAYMEKERKRAAERGYPSPIQPDKESTDRDYDAAVRYCLDHIENVGCVAGTHNEKSCWALADQLEKRGIPINHPHVYFSQLLGMSDNLSFNLGDAGYNVVKYVPYGPIKAVMPYLFRRAQENTSVAGQTGRELSLIIKEKKRRRMN